MDSWSGDLHVRTYEAGYDQRLSIPALCHQLQEAAWNHARGIDWGLEAGQAWIMARLSLRLSDELPLWPSGYRIETWSRGMERMFALRDFTVSQAGRQLAAATTSWLVMDQQSRQLVRFREFKAGAPSNPERRATPESCPRIPRFDDSELGSCTPVGYNDLDLNQHVSNISYVRRILDGYPLLHHSTRRLVSLDINFLSEALPGDETAVGITPRDPKPDQCRVVRASDRLDLCRAWLRWEQTL